MLNVSKTTEILRYDFTKEELSELSLEMAQAVADMNNAENEKKAVMSDFKSQIDAHSAKAHNLAGKIQNGWEMRGIECRVEKDYRKRIAKIYRIDNGDFVKERRIPDDECQMNLEDAAAPDACDNADCIHHDPNVNRCREGHIYDSRACKEAFAFAETITDEKAEEPEESTAE